MQRCLNGKEIDIRRFLDEKRSPVAFPWDLMGLSRPKVGTLHGYLGLALAKYCSAGIEKTVLVGNPTFRQIKLIQEAMVQANYEGVSMSGFIVRWCESGFSDTRLSLEQQVLYILKNCPAFADDFQKVITDRWISGSIDLDPEYFCEVLAWPASSKRMEF